MKIAVVGCGISGVACGNVLKKCGHEVTIFEASVNIGGQWTKTYPDVHLQNIGSHYRVYGSYYEGGMKQNEHPSAEKILRHITQTVHQNDIKVLTGHKVVSISPFSEKNYSSDKPSKSERIGENGWFIETEFKGEGNRVIRKTEPFEKVIIATGQHSKRKTLKEHDFLGLSKFDGKVLLGRDLTAESISDVEDFGNVAVIGFGKTALDIGTLLSSLQLKSKKLKVNHVFREARWAIPKYILGLHYSHIFFSRFSTVFMPCWGHPTLVGQLLNSFGPLRYLFVYLQWYLIQIVLVVQIFFSSCKYMGTITKNGSQRILDIVPRYPLHKGLRTSLLLAPETYYGRVASGDITPIKSLTLSFSQNGIILDGNRKLNVDTVILCTGSSTPTFPFFSKDIVAQLQLENNDISNLQLYRHLIHPKLDNLAFAGFNHGFLHVPLVEVGTLWIEAYFRGAMSLPEAGEMEKCIDRIRSWKRNNTVYESYLLCGVNTRFHQYLDVLLQDLDTRYYRKRNVFSEIFERYDKEEYDSVVDEYISQSPRRSFRTVNIDM